MEKLKEFIPYIVIIVVITLVRTFLFTPIRVNGDSMNQTLFNKEIMILNKVAAIDRFDIVVIKEPNAYLIKRVIGLPNEKVTYQNNKLMINGKETKDPFIKKHTVEDFSIELGANEYFVMGDNRPNSYDSRSLGPIDKSKIVGTTNLVLFPFDHIGIVK